MSLCSTIILALLIPVIRTGDTLDIRPISGFEFDAAETRSPDTVHVVSCDDFLFSPFGHMKSARDLRRGILRNLKFHSTRKRQPNGIFEYQYLQSATSRLILYFNTDIEAQRSSYVMRGQIRDSTIQLAKHIRLGMTKQEFVNTFFLRFPLDQLDRARVFVFETCLDDVRHFYFFDHNRLNKILFDNPGSFWKF
jgi:hypothetical protein